MVLKILGKVLVGEAGLMAIPAIVACFVHEPVMPFIISMAIAAAAGGLLLAVGKPKKIEIYAREGFISVGLSWIVLSVFGALPFVFSGQIPNYVDALFETVSGFTTAGVTVLNEVESFSRSCMFWRVFTQWIGGMGVLVFIMAVIPMSGEHYMHIMRAEMPGPAVGKLVPRAKKSARILYLIYVVMTILEIVLLKCGGMTFYDAILHAFATAGTGGFSAHTSSVAYYNSSYINIVIATFMLLFGINFQIFYLMLIGSFKQAFQSEELKVYLIMIFVAFCAVSINIYPLYKNVSEVLQYSYFQVTSFISTTGFAATSYDEWPAFSRWILYILMVCGACAGSTAGGLKISRIIIIVRSFYSEIYKMLSPRKVSHVWFDGKKVEEKTVRETNTYIIIYFFIFVASVLLVSLDNFDLVTNFSDVLSCLTTVGHSRGIIGATGDVAGYSWAAELVLCLDMLVGRLEIFPVLFLLSPTAWKRR